MKQRLTNERALSLIKTCEKHLDDRGLLGYACARNARRLTDATLEYEQRRNNAIKEHGHEVKNDEGEVVSYGIDPTDEGWAAFVEEVSAISGVESEVDVTTVPPSEVIGKLSGAEILEIDWMLGDDE